MTYNWWISLNTAERFIAVFITAILIYGAYNWFTTESMESMSNTESMPVLALFHRPGCPWCERVMPTWNRLFSEYNGRYGVSIVTVNTAGDSREQELADTQRIESVPTIKYFPNGMTGGNAHEYSGDRTYESLVSYLQNMTR